MLVLYLIALSVLSTLILLPVLNFVFKMLAMLIGFVFKTPLFTLASIVAGLQLMSIQVVLGEIIASNMDVLLRWFHVVMMMLIPLLIGGSLWRKVEGSLQITIGGVLLGVVLGGIWHFVKLLL